eukprot:SAG11_NODE_888_length_6693_cov_2.506218_3_plen_132_part_00
MRVFPLIRCQFRPETPRFTRRKKKDPSISKEKLQREFEAELSHIEAAEEDSDDEDDDDDLAKDLEEEFGENFGENHQQSKSKPTTKSKPNRKWKVVKRTLYFNNPDGTRWKRTELITNPKEVNSMYHVSIF